MKLMCCRNLLACLLIVSGMAGLTDRSLDAAANDPTVRIRRNSALNGEVLLGDFNGDGIADAVADTPRSSSTTQNAVVALGNTDGSFGAARQLPCRCRPLAVGDFDNDGRLDLLLKTLPEPHGFVLVLRGRGDGTFDDTTHVVATGVGYVRFGLIADLDGDGKNDVVLGLFDEGSDMVWLVPGNGDLTFRSTSITGLIAGEMALGGTVADLNRDGKPEIVVANHDSHSLTVFVNHGNFAFETTTRLLDAQANDVLATDINHDGKMDLLVAASHDGADDLYYWGGEVEVLRGDGNGTFQAPVKYDTAAGAWKLVIGDFTRDGIADVATANRSARLSEDSCGHLWDTVSILPGRADGTFGPASSFSLGSQSSNQTDMRFHNSVQSLQAADVNGDGVADLVASEGAIIIAQASDPNWAPTVNAGPDRTANADGSVQLVATAGDSDQDRLTFTWTDSGGTQFIEASPSPCRVTPTTRGVHTFTVTVDDGHGHTASDSVLVDFGGGSTTTPPTVSVVAPAAGDVLTAGQPYLVRWTATAGSAPIDHFSVMFEDDAPGGTGSTIAECLTVPADARSCQWNNPPATEQGHVIVVASDANAENDSNGIGSGESGRFAVRASSSTGTFGNGWSHTDVGSVGAAGSATYDGFVLNGEGYTVTGSGADIWGTADEFHFAWRRVAGDFSIDTRVDSLQNTNAWAKAGLMIRADATNASAMHASIFVSPSKGIAYQRRNIHGGTTSSIAGPTFTAPVWLRMTREGNIITSSYRKHTTDPWTLLSIQTIATFAAAVDVGVAVTSHADGTLATAEFLGVYLQPLPHLTAMAFGGATGSFGGNGTTHEMFASGSDIWGTSDSFIFAAMNMGENRQITARIRSIGNTDPWAKAGVMIRETNLADSKHADAIVSPGKGIAMQYRATSGGVSASAVQLNGAAPVWLRMRRFENSTPGAASGFSTWYSTDAGAIWRRLGDVSFTMTHDALIGIAVTSHKAGVETHVVIDDVRIER